MSPSLPRFRAILFDLDGTLVDSIPFLLECFTGAARSALGREVEPERVLPLVGMPLKTMFAHFAEELSEEQSAACVAAYLAAHRPHAAAKSPLFPDVLPVLDGLRDRGLALGVVTGKSLEGITNLLGPLGLIHRFGALVGCDHGGAPKPAPDGALAAAAALEVAPAETLVVGDSLLDVEMALAAGMTACGVTTGTTSRADLARRAHHVIDSLAELPPLVAARRV
jgi:HAD superfamily hydrolase (TIGR01509 family)